MTWFLALVYSIVCVFVFFSTPALSYKLVACSIFLVSVALSSLFNKKTWNVYVLPGYFKNFWSKFKVLLTAFLAKHFCFFKNSTYWIFRKLKYSFVSSIRWKPLFKKTSYYTIYRTCKNKWLKK